MDQTSPQNLFQISQKLSKDTLDSTTIIFDYYDHVKGKMERGEPVQVIRMVMNPS